jgi:Na+:H+ antiporter, NhaA family
LPCSQKTRGVESSRVVAAVDARESVPLEETPDRNGEFPRLSEAQIEALAKRGERRRTQPGEVLFREGDKGYDFFVVLDGKVLSCPGTGVRRP